MKAEIIAVGTEILTGQITNTNAQFLSEEFAKLGIDVFFQTAVGDNEERLLSIIDLASKRSDLVVLCGGLGPTEDDLTKQTLAKYLGRNLVFDEQASKRLNEFFATRPQFTSLSISFYLKKHTQKSKKSDRSHEINGHNRLNGNDFHHKTQQTK